MNTISEQRSESAVRMEIDECIKLRDMFRAQSRPEALYLASFLEGGLRDLRREYKRICANEVTNVTQREKQWTRIAERQHVIARELREALQTGKVLIVEDDLLVKHRMRLGELGFEEGVHFIAVANLEDARVALASGSIVLLVTDMDFPRTQADLERLQALSLSEFDSREELIVRKAGMELAVEATKHRIPVIASTSREDCEIPNISKGNYSVEDLEKMLHVLRTSQLPSSQQ